MYYIDMITLLLFIVLMVVLPSIFCLLFIMLNGKDYDYIVNETDVIIGKQMVHASSYLKDPEKYKLLNNNCSMITYEIYTEKYHILDCGKQKFNELNIGDKLTFVILLDGSYKRLDRYCYCKETKSIASYQKSIV